MEQLRGDAGWWVGGESSVGGAGVVGSALGIAAGGWVALPAYRAVILGVDLREIRYPGVG